MKTETYLCVMVKDYFKGWGFVRWLRLALGLVLAAQAIIFRDTISGIFAAFLLFQSFANAGCCASASCDLPAVKNESKSPSQEK